MDARSIFEGKKITILGLGLLGRGVGDARYLAEQGAELIITDLKTAEQLAPSIAQLADFPNITYTLGEHRIEDFKGRDFILKAAGVPDPSEYLDTARTAGIPIKMSASWFAEISGIQCIGVTGTRGKTTTTYMIYSILEQAGIPVVLGGNIRGVSTLALLTDITPEHVAVLELDSWQCQGWGEALMSPHIAVFTTFFPDHLNYYSQASEWKGKSGLGLPERTQGASSAYHDSLDLYLNDKAHLFLHQSPLDTLVLGVQCEELIEEKYAGRIPAHVIKVGDHDLPEDWELKIPGDHNRYAAALATEATRALGVADEDIRQALGTFAGVQGRLEKIADIHGVSVYNDTTATTPDATIAALQALDPKNTQNIVLIMGGADKSLEMSPLLLELPKHIKKLIFLSGTGTSRIFPLLSDAPVYDTLLGAVNEAFKHAEPGDIVLLSPAFASFGMFKNEYDRGDQFNEIVKAL